MSEDLEKFYSDIEKDLFHEPINDLEGFLDCARYNEKDDYQLMVEYLQEYPHHIDASDDQGRTAVHMAAANGHLSLLEALYDFRPTPNQQNHEGNTALHFAALNNRLAAARFLLERGWLPTAKNHSGKTPLQEIYDKEFQEMETLLLEFDESLDNYVPPTGASLDVDGDGEESKQTKHYDAAVSSSLNTEVKNNSDEERLKANRNTNNNTNTNNVGEEEEAPAREKVEAVLGSTDVDDSLDFCWTYEVVYRPTMEPRRWRPKFYNPFSEQKQLHPYLPLYRGFFRSMPLHRWSLSSIEKVLGYAALNPSLFGFPDVPTCVVNTAYFLPSQRSKPKGVWAFGTERGCKSVIVPGSLNRQDFDKLDAQLIAPIFRWNPGVEYLYLSRFCQPMVPHLIPVLSKCHRLEHITLEGWNDAVAIHRILMACKNVEVVETFSLDDLPRNWTDEVSVQALVTLIEMHPKLRAVQSHRLFLGDWHQATQFSRCKHNVALVPFSCDWVIVFYALFLMVLSVPCYFIYRATEYITRHYLKLTEAYVWFWSVMVTIASLGLFIGIDMLVQSRYGRAWINMQKYVILAKRRVDIIMNVHQTSLAKIQK